MINSKSLSACKQAQWTSQFNRPLYQDYAFSCIPDTIAKLLTGRGPNAMAPDTVGGRFDRYDAAILFLIDGFGWKFFEGFAEQYPALQRFVQEGIASKISSQFPSTTAAHITSLNTGQEVGETGIYEWFYYEPLIDEMIAPLLFSYAGDHDTGMLQKDGFEPESIFPFETVYQKLAKKGVRSIVMQQEAIAHSAYSRVLLAGADIHPYKHFSQALAHLVELLRTPLKQPTYFFIYHGDIDSVGHRHGITSPQFEDAVDRCWTTIENQFWLKASQVPNKTAVLFTADHGMTKVDPNTTLLLNTICPQLTAMVKKNRSGQPLVPAGSCRDFFLHIEEPFLKEAHRLLEVQLKGVADVVPVELLIKEGFFGRKPPSKRFKERVGNLVVLPYRCEGVFWQFEKNRLEQHFYGAHGGLTPEEMESIFLFAELGR
jgi:hypothetical protein